jgi:general secretion pathway protein D
VSKLLSAFFITLVLGTSCPAFSQAPVRFDFQAITVAQAINLAYTQAFNQPFVIDPAVMTDQRVVSFRFDSTKGDLRAFWVRFMDSLGYAVETRSGVDFLTPKKAISAQPGQEVEVYRPRHRQLSYLVDLLAGLFPNRSFSVQRSVKTSPGEPSPSNAPSGSASSTIQADSDVLVFQGTAEEIGRLHKVLAQIDTPSPEVFVSGTVYEVSTGKSESSAFSLALDLIGRRLGLNIGGALPVGSSITLNTSALDVAVSALSGDSRFKAISTPRLRVKSGSQARLMVGQDVPTLSSVSYPSGGGAAVQGIEYRSSGVILSLTPTCFQESIDLNVDQQISDFAATSTGVSASPTLTKRSLSTSIRVGDGELVLLGGLTSQKSVSSTSGLPFLPRLLRDNSTSDNQTEVLLLMQVNRVSSSF